MLKEAMEYLSGDVLWHADMLECICRDTARVVAAGPKGVLLYECASGIPMLSAANEAESARLLALMPEKPQCIVTHQAFSLPQVREKFGFSGMQQCVQAVYTKPAPPPRTDVFEMRILDERFAETVAKAYHAMDDPPYVRERIAAGAMLGAFENGQLAGFIGSHTEGSVGLLEVLPAFRRRGLGYALEAAEIERQLNEGKTPYCQVICGNTASLALQKKLGLVCSEQQMYWQY